MRPPVQYQRMFPIASRGRRSVHGIHLTASPGNGRLALAILGSAILTQSVLRFLSAA